MKLEESLGDIVPGFMGLGPWVDWQCGVKPLSRFCCRRLPLAVVGKLDSGAWAWQQIWRCSYKWKKFGKGHLGLEKQNLQHRSNLLCHRLTVKVTDNAHLKTDPGVCTSPGGDNQRGSQWLAYKVAFVAWFLVEKSGTNWMLINRRLLKYDTATSGFGII